MRTLILTTLLAAATVPMNTHAEETRITLYSGNFDAVAVTSPSNRLPGLAHIEQTLTRELVRGSNSVDLDRLPRAIDTGSVRLQASQAGPRVTSQRFDFALPDQQQLLRQAIGQRVIVEQTRGATLERSEGTLLAAGSGLSLQLDDGRVRVLANYDRFELAALPDNLAIHPTLRWTVDSPRAGKQAFELEYATGGMAWQAEYRIELDQPGQRGRLSIEGAAQVINRSGLDFPATNLVLVAGQPNLARSPTPTGGAMPAPAPMMARAMAMDVQAPTPEASGEYHAYPIQHPVDLPNDSIQQVPLVAGITGVGFERHYETGHAAAYRPSRPDIQDRSGEEKRAVTTSLEFGNTRQQKLGIPLPAGRVRVFQRQDKAQAFLGEAWLGHVPAGQDVRLLLGEAFDLSSSRRPLQLELAADRLSITETVELDLASAKRDAVTVQVHETLPRWRDWEVLEASHAWEQTGAQSIRFDIKLGPEARTTVRYRVRYRWPANLRP